MDASTAFLEMIQRPPRQVRLAEGALLLCRLADPTVEPQSTLDALDALASGCGEPTLDGLRRHLFTDLGFAGETTDYYRPANSFIDQVVARRRGLPITLSVVMIEVGRRVGVPLDGVGMPGHFLVRDRVLTDVFVDPFAGGAVLDAAGCERVFRSLVGERAPFRAAYLDPVPGGVILTRMVTNLVHAYRRSDDRRGLRWAARLRAACPGVGPDELVQLGQALVRSGAYDEAAALYERAAQDLRGSDAELWQREAALQLARLN